jgi:hypothetical protein
MFGKFTGKIGNNPLFFISWFFNVLKNCLYTVAIHCEWDQWQLGTCSEDCGAGTQLNTRVKLIEEANLGTCDGQAEETVECMIVECPSK